MLLILDYLPLCRSQFTIKHGDVERVAQYKLTEELIHRFGVQLDYLLGFSVGITAAEFVVKETGLGDESNSLGMT